MVDISVISKAGYTLKGTNQVYNIVKVKPIAGMKPQQMIKPENISITVENIAKNQPHVIDLKNVDDIIAGKGTTQNLPEWISDINPPNSRHYFNNIKQGTTKKELNTVIDSSVDVAADMTAIKNGQATIKGNQITVNGRVYEREANGTLAPISGSGFTTLERGSFDALGIYKKFGNTSQADEILNKMGLSPQSKQAALDVWKRNQK